MNTNAFTTPATLKRNYGRTSSAQRKEAIVSGLFLALLFLFGYGLTHHPNFAVGAVQEVQNLTPDVESIVDAKALARVENPFQT